MPRRAVHRHIQLHELHAVSPGDVRTQQQVRDARITRAAHGALTCKSCCFMLKLSKCQVVTMYGGLVCACVHVCMCACMHVCVITYSMSFCLMCVPGTYSSSPIGGSTECIPCPAGTFGDVPALSLPTCSGTCIALPGTYCGQGATASTGILCPPGRYSLGGSSSFDCVNCPIGRFGNTSGLSTSDCSGLCAPGQYGTMQAMVGCAQCPGGRFGNSSGLMTPTCTSTCPAGQFSLDGSPSCTPCPAGWVSSLFVHDTNLKVTPSLEPFSFRWFGALLWGWWCQAIWFK
jgi:hypothetical protein